MELSTQVLLVPTRTAGLIVPENHGGPRSGQFTESLCTPLLRVEDLLESLGQSGAACWDESRDASCYRRAISIQQGLS